MHKDTGCNVGQGRRQYYSRHLDKIVSKHPWNKREPAWQSKQQLQQAACLHERQPEMCGCNHAAACALCSACCLTVGCAAGTADQRYLNTRYGIAATRLQLRRQQFWGWRGWRRRQLRRAGGRLANQLQASAHGQKALGGLSCHRADVDTEMGNDALWFCSQ